MVRCPKSYVFVLVQGLQGGCKMMSLLHRDGIIGCAVF